MAWLARIPLLPLAVAAVLLGLAPFSPEPHLVEKLRMLSQGALSKPMDMVDLALHGGPALLLTLRLIYRARHRA